MNLKASTPNKICKSKLFTFKTQTCVVTPSFNFFALLYVLLLEHPEPSDLVIQIAQAINYCARKNPEPSIFHPKNTLTFFNSKLEKIEKLEYFEELFLTKLKMQPHPTEEMNIKHFHAHLTGEALKTFKNMQRTPTTTLEDILVAFRRKYVKPESGSKT